MPGIYGRKQFYITYYDCWPPPYLAPPSMYIPYAYSWHVQAKSELARSQSASDLSRWSMIDRKMCRYESPNESTVSSWSGSWRRYWYHLTTIAGMSLRHFNLGVGASSLLKFYADQSLPLLLTYYTPSNSFKFEVRIDKPCHSRTNS